MDDGKPWEGSYSESEYSTSAYSSSPMECSSKLDETSSVCSSNSSTTPDVIRLPKPPASLGRRKQRKVYDQTAEVFEFSDLILETIPLEPESRGISTVTVGNENCTSEASQLTRDRYEALRNIDVHDNASFSVQESQNITLQPTNPFVANFVGKFNSKPTIQADIDHNQDKYAAFSEAITISEQTNDVNEVSGSLKWSRSVMGQGQYGWSDQIINAVEEGHA
jgi:hypothetical protein